MEELISPKELSRLLKVSKPWPYVMVKRGLLPCYKIGKVIRFRWADIEAFLERSRTIERTFICQKCGKKVEGFYTQERTCCPECSMPKRQRISDRLTDKIGRKS